MGIVSLLSPFRIRRYEAACIDCGKRAKSCPAVLPVDKLVQISSAECMNCMACVAVCPAENALAVALPRRRFPLRGWTVAAMVLVIFTGVYSHARYMNFWDTHIPEHVYLI